MRRWKIWEDETKTNEYQYHNGKCLKSKFSIKHLINFSFIFCKSIISYPIISNQMFNSFLCINLICQFLHLQIYLDTYHWGPDVTFILIIVVKT